MSFEEGAAISCGTGTAYGALKRLDVSGRDTLAVFGQGPVGLSATMLGNGSSDGRLAAVRRGLHVGPRRIRRRGKQDHVRRQPGYDPPAAHHHASWTFSAVGQEECARFVAARRIPLARLLTHRFRLEEAEAAYRLFDTQTTGKGGVRLLIGGSRFAPS